MLFADYAAAAEEMVVLEVNEANEPWPLAFLREVAVENVAFEATLLSTLVLTMSTNHTDGGNDEKNSYKLDRRRHRVCTLSESQATNVKLRTDCKCISVLDENT